MKKRHPTLADYVRLPPEVREEASWHLPAWEGTQRWGELPPAPPMRGVFCVQCSLVRDIADMCAECPRRAPEPARRSLFRRRKK
jgi:hypothetical protein